MALKNSVALFDDFITFVDPQHSYQNADSHAENAALIANQDQHEYQIAAKKHPWNSVSFLGGKGYNLVKLLQGGFHVPKGFFVVTRVG